MARYVCQTEKRYCKGGDNTTYNDRIAVSKAASVIKSLNPKETDSNAIKYLEKLDEVLHAFFKEYFNGDQWRMDLWRNRYID